MFPRLRNLSIKFQLILAIVTATAVACLVTAGLNAAREVEAYAHAKRTEMSTIAALFATMSSDAVKAGDAARAHDTLGAMARMPGIVHVRIAGQDGRTLAEHGFGARLVGSGGGLDFASLLAGRPALVTSAIIHGGETVGQVEILATTVDFRDRLLSLLANAAIATALALVLGVLAAHGMRRSIADRIGKVATAMTTVQRTHRYDLALADDRRDEVGVLVRGFNSMMGEVRARDQRLADHRADLEHEVERRTIDLMVAKRAADDANAAKSQFLATMSHEIRTPLNGLMVMAELLAAAELAPRERRYADVVVRAGGSLLAIINDVLDYSKIEAGRIELETVDFDMAEVVDDVAQLFASKAAAQGIDLATHVHPAVGRVTGDPVRMGQIVGNLVNNAIKFTSAGHVLVKVGPDPARQDAVLVSVSDTGIGIPEDKLALVFESFAQASQSTARRYGGTGLGLAICRRLVTAMGGEIGVDSREGEGSRFWFSAPLPFAGESASDITGFAFVVSGGATSAALECYAENAVQADDGARIVIVDPARGDAAAAAAKDGGARVVVMSRIGDDAAERWMATGLASAQIAWPIRRRDLAEAARAVAPGALPLKRAAPGSSERIRYAGARVLVVDDAAVNREVAFEALKRFGILAETSVDGEAAITKIRRGAYDLILMDGSMPGMDGFETSRAIRALEADGGLPRQAIVALTAHALGDGADAWRAAGMDGLLLKPFTLAQIKDCLIEHLGLPAGDRNDEIAAPPAVGPAPPQPGLLDPETTANLAMLAAHDPAPVRRIVRLFVEHSRPALDQLAVSLEGGSADTVASAAHALKSMAMSVGASALASALGEIEKAVRIGGTGPALTDMTRLGQLLDASIGALAALPWMASTEAAVVGDSRHR